MAQNSVSKSTGDLPFKFLIHSTPSVPVSTTASKQASRTNISHFTQGEYFIHLFKKFAVTSHRFLASLLSSDSDYA